MTRLFICSTQFQIISALCLLNSQKKYLSKIDNDVIIEGGLPYGDIWGRILLNSGFFRNVYVLKKEADFQPLCIRKRILLSRKLRNKTQISWKDLFLILSGCGNIYLNKTIVNNNRGSDDFNYIKYHELFFGSATDLVVSLLQYFKRPNTKIFVYDEGVSSYVGYAWAHRVTPEAIYLFNTDLIKTSCKTYKISPLSKLKRSSILDGIEKELKIRRFNIPDLLFFDQWLGMPTIYDSISLCEWKNSSYIEKKINLLRRIVNNIGNNKLGIRLHPTSCIQEVVDFYQAQQLDLIIENQGIPFELSLIIAKKRPKLLLTIFSSAVITPLTLGIDHNIKAIVLWKLFTNDQALKDFTKDNSITDFFEKLRSKYPNRIYIPESETELTEILHRHS